MKMYETRSALKLKNIFDDADYAWHLLYAQTSIQMNPVVTAQQIAQLLQLYMIGVQTMNSISDQRQSYFKNKVTSLMTKGAVIKSLKKNPMRKKDIHQETSCKLSQRQISQKESQPQGFALQPIIGHLELKKKQRQFQMRVAYSSHQNNPDTLRKLILQEQCREQSISVKIKNIISNHEQRLEQRIKQRKLRTATYRAQSELNQQSETQPSTNNFRSSRKEEYFQQNELGKQAHAREGSQNNMVGICARRWKSLQNNKSPPQTNRKYTIDLP